MVEKNNSRKIYKSIKIFEDDWREIKKKIAGTGITIAEYISSLIK